MPHQSNCLVPTVHLRAESQGWGKRTWLGRNAMWDWEKNKWRKYETHFREHHLFTLVVFEGVYIAASVTVQGSETGACNKKGSPDPNSNPQSTGIMRNWASWLRSKIFETACSGIRHSSVNALQGKTTDPDEVWKENKNLSTYLLSYLLLPAGLFQTGVSHWQECSSSVTQSTVCPVLLCCMAQF